MTKLEKIVKQTKKTIFFDISDSAGMLYESAFGIFENYYKKQIYVDKNYYTDPKLKDPRLHVNKYINNKNNHSRSLAMNYSHLNSTEINRIKISWNVGIGDYRTFISEYNYFNPTILSFQTKVLGRSIHLPNYKFRYQNIDNRNKIFDVISCFNLYENNKNNEISLHRKQTLNMVENLKEKYSIITGFFPKNEYYNYYNEFKPDFSHKHAAVAAGLGIIGLSSLLVHPRYGAAVHLSSVITKAPLEADPMLDATDDNPCDNCGYCVQICPVKAIDPEKTIGFTIDGKEYNHTKHNKIKCMYGCSGYTGHEYQIGNKKVGTWSFNHRPVSNAEEIIKNMHEPDNEVRHPMELAEMAIDQELQWCGNCHKICVGDRKQKDTLFKMHLNSGMVEIPDDPTRLLKLRDKNYQVMPFDFKKNGYDLNNIKPKWDND